MKVLILSLFSIQLLIASILDFKTIESDFTQTVTNKSGNTITYKGTIKIKGEDKILWSYKTPVLKNVFITKNKAIIDEPELEQAITSRLSSDLNIVTIINKSKKIGKNTYENKLDETKYTVIIENNILKSVRYRDELDNDVGVLFTNFKRNFPIQDEIFDFKIPPHYDVIKK